MAEDRPNTFAARLTELREGAGMSQYALAKKSGLTKQAVSRLEMGTRSPTWDTVQLLALALDVEPNDFRDPSLTLPTPAAPRPPGRPRKLATDADGRQPKRPRGRPRKAPAAAQETPAASKA